MDKQPDEKDARINVQTEDGKVLEGELIFEFEENGDTYVVYGIEDTMYAARYDDNGKLMPVEADEWPLIERMIEAYFADEEQEELEKASSSPKKP